LICKTKLTIGGLNAERSNLRYGALDPKIGHYGECDFEVDFKLHKTYIKPNIRGDIARTYFYVRDTYGYQMNKQEIRIMRVWDKEDPVDAWETTRISLINSN